MRSDDLNITIEELDRMCHLYMECQLSVLEEKELEYILSSTPFSSPAIADVKALMDVGSLPSLQRPAKVARFRGWWKFSGVAAAAAIVVGVFFHLSTYHPAETPWHNDSDYIAAYRHGKRLTGTEAVISNEKAMAMADSLINYAATIERENLRQAENILSLTNN